MLQEYIDTADALTQRIRALVPKHSEILTMRDPWPLLKLADFSDLQPSLLQVSFALATVQKEAQA